VAAAPLVNDAVANVNTRARDDVDECARESVSTGVALTDEDVAFVVTAVATAALLAALQPPPLPMIGKRTDTDTDTLSIPPSVLLSVPVRLRPAGVTELRREMGMDKLGGVTLPSCSCS